jgi:hypothetical protein
LQGLGTPEYIPLDDRAAEAEHWRERFADCELALLTEKAAHQETKAYWTKLLNDVFASCQYAVALVEERENSSNGLKLPTTLEILLELQLQRGRSQALLNLIDSSINTEEQSDCARGLQRYLQFAHHQVETHLKWDDGTTATKQDTNKGSASGTCV